MQFSKEQLLTQARDLIDLGWVVYPCHAGKGGILANGYVEGQDRMMGGAATHQDLTAQEMYGGWNRAAWVGVDTGLSGLVVLDLDDGHDRADVAHIIDNHPTMTAHDGAHFYYKANGNGQHRSKPWDNIDVLGGGNVIWYGDADDTPIATWPIKEVLHAPKKTAAPGKLETGLVPEGNRNMKMLDVGIAIACENPEMKTPELTARLVEWDQERGYPPINDLEEIQTVALNAYKTRAAKAARDAHHAVKVADAQVPTEGQRLQAIRKMEMAAQNWVWKDVMSEGLYVLAGPPKAGKTFFGLQLASAVKQGQQFLGRECPGGDVAYVALEDGLRRIKTRADQLNLEGDIEMFFNMPTVEIDDWIQKLDHRLIVIDTGPKGMNMGSEHDNYAAAVKLLRPVQQWAIKNGRAVILTWHTRKEKKNDKGEKIEMDMQDILGSTAIRAATDGNILIAPPTKLKVESRDASNFELEMVRMPQGGWASAGDPVGLEVDIHTLLVQARGREFKRAEINEEMKSASASGVTRALASLEEKGLIERPTYGHYKART